MYNVINISDYFQNREVASSTAFQQVGKEPSDPIQLAVNADDEGQPQYLTAQVLYKIDPDTELSRFQDLVSDAIRAMEECTQQMRDDERLAADDSFMSAKQTLSELLMFRDMNDSVGLICLRLFQCASQVIAVTEKPALPETMLRVLQRLWRAPFMNFGEAILLSEQIEAVVNLVEIPGLAALTSELLSSSQSD